METKDINTLNPNPKNPRKINKHDFESLLASVKRFGDLSGIVFNVATQQLVGGHQRIEVFKRLGGQPTITKRLLTPNSVGTVAVGYVLLGDEQYGYREVSWDKGFEDAANIAANRIQGDFDVDLLGEVTYAISQLENAEDLLAMTGQDPKEIKRLLENSGAIEEEPEPEQSVPSVGVKMEFSFSEDIAQLVNQAIGDLLTKRHAPAGSVDTRSGAIEILCRDYLETIQGPTDAAPTQ